MKRTQPSADEIEVAREHARQKRIEAGLPPEAPENALYDGYWKRRKVKTTKEKRS